MPVAPRQPSSEAYTLLTRSAPVLSAAMLRVADAVARKKPTDDAVDALGSVLAQTLSLSDMLGRRRTVLWARTLGFEMSDAGAVDVLPRVPFTEAIDDLASRHPLLAASRAEVEAVYAGHGFTLAKTSEVEIVARVQQAILEALRAGQSTYDASAVIESMGDWTRSYAETVYRNNVSTAYSAGMDRQLEDPDVRAVIVALRYTTAGDVDVRESHRKMDGTIAPPEHPIWDSRTPPCGHKCRCGRDFMSREDLRREGLITSLGAVAVRIPNPGTGPDPGFGGRATARIYVR